MSHGFYRNDSFYSVPTSFNEVSRKKAIRIFKVLASPLEVPQKQFKITRIILNLFYDICLKYPFFIPTVDELIDLMRFAKHFLEKERIVYFKNHLPKIGSLYGPSDVLGNINLIEWIKCFTFHQLLVQTKDVKYLNLILAVLYRPRKNWFIRLSEKYEMFGHKMSDDIRERYDDTTLEQRAEKIGKKWKNWQKNAVLLFYIGSTKRIGEKNPAIFPKSEEDESSRKNQVSRYGWDDTLYDLSELKGKTIEEIAEWRFDTVLFILTKAKERHEQRELDNK